MSQKDSGEEQNVTLVDLRLARAYYSVLVDVARLRGLVTYGELIDRAKAEFPDDEVVKNAIAVSTGRRLNVVRMYTNPRGLPDLSSLVVNKTEGECGDSYRREFDPVEVRKEVYSFDWSGVSKKFVDFIDQAGKAIKPRKKRKREAALKLMSAYYQENRGTLPPSIRDQRELIIELLEEGLPEKDAFEEASKELGLQE